MQKTDELIEMPFGMISAMGPGNQVVDGRPDSMSGHVLGRLLFALKIAPFCVGS